MLYRFFIYKSATAVSSASAPEITNAVIERKWETSLTGNCMNHFNADAVKAQIEAKLGKKCDVIVCYPSSGYKKMEFLNITSSYAMVREVLPVLHTIAIENGLVLYDAETERFFYDSFVTLRICDKKVEEEIPGEKHYIRELRKTYSFWNDRDWDYIDTSQKGPKNKACSERAVSFYNCIQKEMHPVWRIRKIYSSQNERDYAVTLKKAVEKKAFSERVESFYNCLKNNLRKDEELLCKDRTFIISAKNYSLSFTLEGYKKHANMVGYYEDGRARQDILRRMSVEVASKWLNGCSTVQIEDIKERMNFREMVEKFPNPADRFVNSVRITKWLMKQIFSVRYSHLGYYGSEILFHVIPDPYFKDAESISVLKIGEESATYILPFINDIYPYFYKRYYLTENHLPVQMWREITDRIKEAQRMIVHDTYSPELAKYIDCFDLFVLDKNDDPRIRKWSENYSPVDFVYDHRYEIAYLYEIFIQWSETQMDCYMDRKQMFNIEGP